MNGLMLFALAVGIVLGWGAKWTWDWLVDWWFDASGGWLKDIFALIGVITVVALVWNYFT